MFEKIQSVQSLVNYHDHSVLTDCRWFSLISSDVVSLVYSIHMNRKLCVRNIVYRDTISEKGKWKLPSRGDTIDDKRFDANFLSCVVCVYTFMMFTKWFKFFPLCTYTFCIITNCTTNALKLEMTLSNFKFLQHYSEFRESPWSRNLFREGRLLNFSNRVSKCVSHIKYASA